jgi:hypothetical protein
MATVSCVYCKGIGMRERKRGEPAACNCVFRRIFRACLEQFQICAWRQGQYTSITLERCRGAERHVFWAMKNEDYMADFLLVSRRLLNKQEYDVFRFHFLLGADWKLCCRRIGIDRGNFFHIVYRIQQRLGRAFSELEPYPLYPLDEYFNAVVGGAREPIRALPPRRETGRILRPPLKKIA